MRTNPPETRAKFGAQDVISTAYMLLDNCGKDDKGNYNLSLDAAVAAAATIHQTVYLQEMLVELEALTAMTP